MTCEECIHKAVCYRVDSVKNDYAQKCGDFVSDCKTLEQESCENDLIEIDMYSVIKQNYIERDVLDKVRAEIETLNPINYVYMSSYDGHRGASDMKDDVLAIIDKYKAESENNKWIAKGDG